MKLSTKPVKGMRDFLPQDKEMREYLKSTIKEVYKSYGFQEIETPAVENIDLLTNSKGGENLKLLFKILKRGNKLNLNKENLNELELADLGLRYDLTLPLSRFYANNKETLPSPFKSIQIGNVYRAENPQKGRYRTFVQCDVDIIGEEGIMAEIELISTISKALEKLGLRDFKICINDRRILRKLVQFSGFKDEQFESVCVTLDKLDKVGIEGVEKELNKKGYDDDCINKFIKLLDDLKGCTIDELVDYNIEQEVIDDLKSIITTIDIDSKGNYDIEFDYSLVRGMGYYTGAIFEIKYGDRNMSIAGGGRYDKMIGNIINQDISACGFSIGFERIVDILKEENYKIPDENRVAFLYDKKNDCIADVFQKSQEIRELGNIVSIYPKQKKLSKQLDRLKEQEFNQFCIYDKDEIEIKLLNK